MRQTLATCGVALLVLAGCSGNSDKKSQASPTSTAVAGPTTTVRPVDTSFSGQNSAQFCALARTYNDRFTKVGANPTPAELRTVAQEGQTAITQAVGAAPAEIKADVGVLAGAFTTLLDELQKVNFEADKLPVTALAQLQTPEFQQSTTRFQAYTRTVCGVS